MGFDGMELWIPITLAAAFLQNVRSSLQKYLKGRMGTTGATFVRFGFGMPFVLAFLAFLHFQIGYSFPAISPRFLIWMTIGGLSQIAATFLLVHLFSHRNFAVGTAYSRTEPAQAAIFGLLLLGETISVGAVIAIAVCVAGVMLISVAKSSLSPKSLVTSLFERTALIGLTSGTGFGLSAISYRAASLALGGPNFLMQATVTLAFVIILQTVLMLGWILLREPEELSKIAKAWRPSLVTGMAGATASLGWFTAMTLQNAAIVKALAQVEMLLAFATTVFFFKEKINRLETIGCLLVAAGVVLIVLLR
jgi:drug/metabolite transporter (DMT)-like permease